MQLYGRQVPIGRMVPIEYCNVGLPLGVFKHQLEMGEPITMIEVALVQLVDTMPTLLHGGHTMHYGSSIIGTAFVLLN